MGPDGAAPLHIAACYGHAGACQALFEVSHEKPKLRFDLFFKSVHLINLNFTLSLLAKRWTLFVSRASELLAHTQAQTVTPQISSLARAPKSPPHTALTS